MLSRRRFLFSAAATAPVLSVCAQKRNAPPEPHAAPCDPAAALPPPIAALSDRHHEITPISVDERNARLDRARELMKSAPGLKPGGLDAVLITTGASLLYFTGARWGQSERLFAYVIPRSAAPFVICPWFERDRLNELMSTFPERESTLTYLWQEHDDPFDLLRRALAEVSITTGALGIEEHTQFAFANAIASACPALRLASATPVTTGCRSIKSPAELALMRLANRITFDVYRAVFQSCGPGDTNHRVVELINAAYARCGVSGEASCNVGVNSAVPHGSPAPQVIHPGEIVLLDDGCLVDGYQSDISRSFVYGNPTDLQKKVFDIVHRAQSAALAAARPGAEMGAVDSAARKLILDAGYGPGYDFFNHRVGHGIGLDMHEWPYLVYGNTAKLAPGMTFSDEPGVYIHGKFGIRLEDDMFITESGAELFTPQSPSLQDPFGTGGGAPRAKAPSAPQD